MNDNTQQLPPAFLQSVVLPCLYRGEVRSDIAYGADGRQFDVFYPEDRGQRPPLVVFVFGISDRGFAARFGCRMKDLEPYRSWARLLASEGMASVLYSSEEPVADSVSLLQYLRQHGAELGVDERRIGIWSCSGNVPNALNVLAQEQASCAVLFYGFTMDLDGATAVADASAQFGFVDPRLPPERLPAATPLMLIKAGKDEFPGLNEGIDSFLATCRHRGGECDLLEYAEGMHAFDLLDASAPSQEVVRSSVDYLLGRLRGDTDNLMT